MTPTGLVLVAISASKYSSIASTCSQVFPRPSLLIPPASHAFPLPLCPLVRGGPDNARLQHYGVLDESHSGFLVPHLAVQFSALIRRVKSLASNL